MNTNKRLTTTLILGVIAVAAVLFIVLGPIGKEDEDAEPTEDPAFVVQEPLFPDAQGDIVTQFVITDAESGEVVAARFNLEDVTWTIEAAPEGSDTGFGPDSGRILSAVSSLPGLTPTRTVTEVERLADYGLGDPKYTIQFTTSSGQEYILLVGNPTPGDTDYYAMLPGSADVYLVSKFALESLIGFLEEPPFLTEAPTPTPTPEPTAEPTTEG